MPAQSATSLAEPAATTSYSDTPRGDDESDAQASVESAQEYSQTHPRQQSSESLRAASTLFRPLSIVCAVAIANTPARVFDLETLVRFLIDLSSG